jgi:DNA-binding GntR family transcriptional regulator
MNLFFGMPEITLDRSKLHSLRQQIYSQMAAAIRQGALPDGARLPSSRLLAKLLHVSRNTVVDAYERLLEDGLIKTRAGSGIQVDHTGPGIVPNFSNLRRTARAAHYPVRTIQFKDLDGTMLYLNSNR